MGAIAYGTIVGANSQHWGRTQLTFEWPLSTAGHSKGSISSGTVLQGKVCSILGLISNSNAQTMQLLFNQ